MQTRPRGCCPTDPAWSSVGGIPLHDVASPAGSRLPPHAAAWPGYSCITVGARERPLMPRTGSSWIARRWHLYPQLHAAWGLSSWRRNRSPVTVPRASGENPGQDDPDAAGVLDLDSGPEMGTSPGSSNGPEPGSGHARDRHGEAGRRGPDHQGAGGYGCPERPSSISASR